MVIKRLVAENRHRLAIVKAIDKHGRCEVFHEERGLNGVIALEMPPRWLGEPVSLVIRLTSHFGRTNPKSVLSAVKYGWRSV